MTFITTRGLLVAAIAVACAAAAAPPAGDLLDPEVAFPVTGSATRDGIDLAFHIADGYYLYGDRIRLDIDPGLRVGAALVPKGEPNEDPFLGRKEVLRHAAVVHLPFAGNARAGTYLVNVTAQGCAEGKACYAPFSQAVRVTVGGGS